MGSTVGDGVGSSVSGHASQSMGHNSASPSTSLHAVCLNSNKLASPGSIIEEHDGGSILPWHVSVDVLVVVELELLGDCVGLAVGCDEAGDADGIAVGLRVGDVVGGNVHDRQVWGHLAETTVDNGFFGFEQISE